MNGVLMRRGEVMALLGVGREKFDSILECGLLNPIHMRHDRKGNPVDRAMYRRSEVMELVSRPVSHEKLCC